MAPPVKKYDVQPDFDVQPDYDVQPDIPVGLDVFKGENYKPEDMPVHAPPAWQEIRKSSISEPSTTAFKPYELVDKPIPKHYDENQFARDLKTGFMEGPPRIDTMRLLDKSSEDQGTLGNISRIARYPAGVVDELWNRGVRPLLSPMNIAAMGAAIAQPETAPFIGAYFGGQMGAQIPGQVSNTYKAINEKGLKNPETWTNIGDLALNTAMTAGIVGGSKKFGERPQAEPIKFSSLTDPEWKRQGMDLRNVRDRDRRLMQRMNPNVEPPTVFDPKVATRDQIIQEALRRQGVETPKVEPPPVTEPSGRIILPEGWTAEVGNVARGERAMTDKIAKKLTFANEEDLANNSVYNHEASHALINALPEKARTNLVDSYIGQKQNTWQKDGHSKEYMVMNNFHREDMAIDLGNYFTHPEMVEPGVRKLFDLWFPKKKGGAKAEVTEPIRDRANRGEPVIAQDENGKVKANPNFVKTEVTPPEVKPPDLTTEGKPVVESPKVETPTAKPKSAPPDRRIKIHRGNQVAIDVTFPDAFHKDLFTHVSRFIESSRGNKPYTNYKSVEEYLARQLGVDPSEVFGIAKEYRQSVINGTKGLADQSDFNAPRLDSGRNEFHHGLVPPKTVGEETGVITPQGEIKTVPRHDLHDRAFPNTITSNTKAFRYSSKDNTITWNSKPNAEDFFAVDNHYGGGTTQQYMGGNWRAKSLSEKDYSPEFHHGLVPPKKDTIIVRGKDVQSIDAAIQARELEGYKAIDVDAKGGIIMTRTSKVKSEPKPSLSLLDRALQDDISRARDAADLQRENNRFGHARQAERARAVSEKVSGEEGARQQLAAMGGEFEKVTLPSIRHELTQNQINEIYDRITTNTNDQFKQIRAKKGFRHLLDGEYMPPSEIDITEQMTGLNLSKVREFYHGIMEGKELPETDVRRSLIADILNIPRAIMFAQDLSFGGRQGITMVHTKAWWKMWKEGVKSFGFEKMYRATMDSILEKPNALRVKDATGKMQPSVYERMGLALTDLTHNLDKREEQMQSTLAERVPIVRRSNRAATIMADKLRSDNADTLLLAMKSMYDSIYATQKTGWFERGIFPDSYVTDPKLARTGLSKMLRGSNYIEDLNPYNNDVVLKALGNYINNATGRSSLIFHIPEFAQKFFSRTKEGKLRTEINFERTATFLNAAFISPRLIMSRFQMLNPRNYVLTDPFIRKQYLKSLCGLALYYSTIAGLAKTAGAAVNTDPDNSDFLKIRFGNVRFDYLAGFQQFLVLYHRLWSNRMVSPTTGQGYEMGQKFGGKTRLDAIADFARNKANPPAALAMNWLDASKAKPFQVGDTLMRQFIFLVDQDLIDIARENPKLLPLGAISGIGGAGIQTFGKGRSDRLFPGVFPAKSDWIIPSNARIR